MNRGNQTAAFRIVLTLGVFLTLFALLWSPRVIGQVIRLAGLLTQSQATASHAIAFETTSIDVGRVPYNAEAVNAVFRFSNALSRPISIRAVRSSCNCTVSAYTKDRVEPGQTGSITVTYKPKEKPHLRGPFEQRVVATFEGMEDQPQVLKMLGNTVELVAVRPSAVNFGDFDAESPPSREVELRNEVQEPVEVSAAGSARSLLQVHPAQAVIGPGQTVRLTLTPVPASGGRLDDTVVLKLKAQTLALPDLTIPASGWEHKGQVWASHSEISFGFLNESHKPVRTIRLTSSTGTPFVIDSIRSIGMRISASFAKDARARHEVVLTTASTHQPAGRTDGRVVISVVCNGRKSEIPINTSAFISAE